MQFKMMHFYQDTLIIQTIYNILQKCEQWERQPISLNTSSWLTNVQGLATAVRVVAGFSDYTFKIFTLQPAPLMRMSRCVARRNSSGSRQQGPKSSHGTHWEAAESLTWPMCTAPCVLKDHVQSTLEAAKVTLLQQQKDFTSQKPDW